MNGKKKTLLIAFFLLVFLVLTKPLHADQLSDLQSQINDYTKKIQGLQQQANTLSNQIAQFNAQIYLTQLKINQTQEQIVLLGGRIDQLETSLQALSNAFSSRAVATYKMARSGESFFLLITSENLTKTIERFHYLQRAQVGDHNLLVRLQGAQNTYKQNKTDQEKLQQQLDDQKKQLAIQKAAKDQLLAITKNDEARYQDLLAKALAELQAIQSIVAGQGTESEVRKVGESEAIASVIPIPSACSNGGHVHFEVVKDGAHQNPANFLSPKAIVWNNSPDGPFGFSGSWQWPVNDPIEITQGYGMTYYAATLKWYGGGPHTGIDMINANNDLTVKAARPGTLYRGGIACGGGTLRYVHVKQDDGYDTYYLHVNY